MDRYYIDERIGCIAIIDTQSPDYDPERRGVEEGTNGCVWYEHGFHTQIGGWELHPGARGRAEMALTRLQTTGEGDAN